MLDQLKVNELQVRSEFTTIEAYVIDRFAQAGITVMVTRSGDAPTEPLRFRDPVRCMDIVATVATETEMDRLMKIPEMRQRLQILESVPYTDIIIGHEFPTDETLAFKKKRKENFREGLSIAGKTIGFLATVAVYAVIVP